MDLSTAAVGDVIELVTEQQVLGATRTVEERQVAAGCDRESIRACARFKVPKEITFLDALPRNPSGKVLKRELRGGT